jgi:DNA-binding NarL/FixJ family response regulator
MYGSFVETRRERTGGILFRGLFDMKEIKILIAEDQELIRKSLRIILNLTPDIEVVGTAENGEAAVQQAGELQPDLVLMDIHMPVMNGVRATAQIKQRWPAVKVMILTTFQEVQYVVEALNSGAEGYILKDIDPDDLASAIRLVHRGETMITQEVAKTLFSRSLQGGIASSAKSKETDYRLSEKEIKVLQLIADGLANRQIAERLFLSEGTVKNHVSTIYSKLNVNNRAAAMKKASDERLL